MKIQQLKFAGINIFYREVDSLTHTHADTRTHTQTHTHADTHTSIGLS